MTDHSCIPDDWTPGEHHPGLPVADLITSDSEHDVAFQVVTVDDVWAAVDWRQAHVARLARQRQIDLTELAHYFGVKEKTAREWIRREAFPAPVGQRIYTAATAVDVWALEDVKAWKQANSYPASGRVRNERHQARYERRLGRAVAA